MSGIKIIYSLQYSMQLISDEWFQLDANYRREHNLSESDCLSFDRLLIQAFRDGISSAGLAFRFGKVTEVSPVLPANFTSAQLKAHLDIF